MYVCVCGFVFWLCLLGGIAVGGGGGVCVDNFLGKHTHRHNHIHNTYAANAGADLHDGGGRGHLPPFGPVHGGVPHPRGDFPSLFLSLCVYMYAYACVCFCPCPAWLWLWAYMDFSLVRPRSIDFTGLTDQSSHSKIEFKKQQTGARPDPRAQGDQEQPLRPRADRPQPSVHRGAWRVCARRLGAWFGVICMCVSID